MLIEKFKDQGFEAWRQLLLRYNPTGGRFELDRMAHLLQRKQCKTVSEIPAAVDLLEKEISSYEARAANKFPQEWKIPLLIQLLPANMKNEMEMKLTLGERDYNKMVNSIVGYSNEARVTKQRAKHSDDMDVDELGEGGQREYEYPEQDWREYCEMLEYQNEELNYMGKTGKGGGK